MGLTNTPPALPTIVESVDEHLRRRRAAGAGRERNARGVEALERAVVDLQPRTAVEHDPRRAGLAVTVESQAAQIDNVVGAGVDGDAAGARDDTDAGDQGRRRRRW